VVGVSSVSFLTYVEVWAYFDHGFELGAPPWQQRCKVPETLRARSGKGVARMEQREQPSGAARGTSDLSDAYCLGHASDFYGGHFGSREDRRRAVMRALRPVDADVADALEAQQAKLYPSAARTQNVTALRRGAAVVVTG